MKRNLLLTLALIFIPILLVSCTPGSKVYTGSAEDLLCQAGDMPGGSENYKLREAGINRQTNDVLRSQALDIPGTNQYIDETGRIEGWLSDFLSNNPADESLADEIFCQVVQFKTIAGSGRALHWELWDEQVKFSSLSVEDKIGQDTRLDYRQYTDQQGKQWDIYHLQFQYQNMLGNIQAFFSAGFDQKTAIAMTTSVAKNLLKRFQSAQWSEPDLVEGQ